MKNVKVIAALLLIVTGMACSSTGAKRPSDIEAPILRLSPVGSIFFGSGFSAPITIETEVTNRANVPVKLEQLEISSPGMVEYHLRPERRFVNDTIAPGETKRISFLMTAIATTRVLSVSEPLTMRAIATFSSGNRRWNEIVIQP